MSGRQFSSIFAISGPFSGSFSGAFSSPFLCWQYKIFGDLEELRRITYALFWALFRALFLMLLNVLN